MISKSLLFFIISILSYLSTPVFATLVPAGPTYLLGKQGFRCPTLTSANLNAMRNGKTLKLEDNILTFKTDMAPAAYAKQIPGPLYIISKNKTFNPTKTYFTILADETVSIHCQYTWQSALASLTKNTHVFTLMANLHFKLKNLITIPNPMR